MMEKVHNKMTRLIPNNRNMSHQERNELIGMTSHQVRRMRGNLIQIFKKIENENLFCFRNNGRLRGHDKTIVVPNIKKKTLNQYSASD